MTAPFLIKTDKDQRAEMPSGEGFPRTGFISAWQGRIMWKVAWFETDTARELLDRAADLPSVFDGGQYDALIGESGVPYDARIASNAGDKFAYYFVDKERAELLCELLNANEPRDWPIRPAMVWYFWTDVSSILGMDDKAREKFKQPVLTFDVRNVTLRSKKLRHAYQFLALPAFVSAYARVMGMKVHEFDLSPLTQPDPVFTPETELELIGDADGGYADAYFWKERIKIWKDLGEDDPEKWHTIEEGTKFSTTSAQLDSLLQATVSPWLEPVYARLIPVPDPKFSAAYERGDEKVRPTIPVIAEIFASREDAQAAAEKDRPQGTESAAPKPAAEKGLAYPVAWSGAPDAWAAQVREIKDGLEGLAPPIAAAKIKAIVEEDALGYSLAATLEELTAWLKVV